VPSSSSLRVRAEIRRTIELQRVASARLAADGDALPTPGPVVPLEFLAECELRLARDTSGHLAPV
jgi:hypothetical protein